MTSQKPKYDVAISFLSQDESTATALYNRLNDGLEVFFYPRSQEELAGTDGMESMRKPFLDESRIVVVLYQEPWGATPWTRIEQTAIQEGCLNQGWHRLFFIVLANNSKLPVWLPQNHIRFNYTDFGLEGAVGAIKARVQENGGIITPMTPLKRAAIYEQDALYLRDKKNISSHEGMSKVNQKVLEMFAEIERHCNEINQSGRASIQVGSNSGRCILTTGRVSLAIAWRQQYTNSTDGCELMILEYNGRIGLPHESLMYIFEQPTELRAIKYLPDLSSAREYGWARQGASEFLSSITLAEKCVLQFLSLATRADRGEFDHIGA